jgi:hypothetical protein
MFSAEQCHFESWRFGGKILWTSKWGRQVPREVSELEQLWPKANTRGLARERDNILGW